MFTCGAEKKATEMILFSHNNIKSTILKVGHHSSSTPTTHVFINRISPQIAIIQAVASNSYEHYNGEVLSILSNASVKIYRNDVQGDIIVSTTWKTYTIDARSFTSINQPLNIGHIAEKRLADIIAAGKAYVD